MPQRTSVASAGVLFEAAEVTLPVGQVTMMKPLARYPQDEHRSYKLYIIS